METEGNRFFKCWKNRQLQILYPAKVSFRNEWNESSEKYPSEQRELKEYVTNRPTFKAKMTIK